MARRIDGIAEVPRAFDAHLDLLCVANGVVDLRTGNLGRHDPTLRLTKLSDVAYRPAAAHPDVTALLQVVSDETRPWLRRLAGYAATGHASEDVVAVFDGGGANGKTTLLEALGAVLGDYGGAVSPQLVMRTRHEPHPTIKADLLGKRLVWISETEEGGVFRMEQVKALTGGDQISARFMRGDFFTFQPTHTLVIATNHRPSVGSTEYAAWRRLRLVTFPYTYRPDGVSRATERMQDRGLRHRVTTGTAQREALLAWLVAGAIDWYREGLGGCQEIEEATSAWRASEDVIMRFAGDCLQFGPDYSVGGAALYDAYKKWCQNEHRPPLSNRDFAQQFLVHDRVVTAGVTKARPKGVTQYRGVDLRVLGS